MKRDVTRAGRRGAASTTLFAVVCCCGAGRGVAMPMLRRSAWTMALTLPGDLQPGPVDRNQKYKSAIDPV